MLISLACIQASAEESSISRTQAAQMAQQKFGGKVISIDEVEPAPAASDEDASAQPAPPSQNNPRFVVKLMQSGRVQVVNLDAQGQPLNPAP
ncbi:MAG TPA: hypothetical protein PK011_14450 [Marinagarivorans sp.]|nr:hypothetical protein [Marinagarivorans sp.]HNG60603.1 hypothetical protein [Cellvibrionaceae bacterium]